MQPTIIIKDRFEISFTMKMQLKTVGTYLIICGVAINAFSACAERSSPRQRPNVLVVMADQWRAQAIARHGDPNVQTPYLDELAARGIDFVNAVAEIPVCT